MYLKMLASGVPTAVRLMWIPLSELNIYQQAVLVAKLFHGLLDDLWNEQNVSFGRKFLWNEIKYTTADLLTVVVFPIVEFLIPYRVIVFVIICSCKITVNFDSHFSLL